MNIILLSGGSGKRLWPLSNDIRSKQFIKLFKNSEGSYDSMLQRVFYQITKVDPKANITVATSKSQASMIRHQLGDKVNICVEPCRKDTFPAIALAAAFLHDVKGFSPQAPIIVCPVDPYVDLDYFEHLKKLEQITLEEGSTNLCLMGIEPSYPSEKYGYIMAEDQSEISSVREFKEKPDQITAQQYLQQGALWNGGIFAFRLNYLLEIAHSLIDFTDYEDLYDKYGSLKKISFDYAVVEQEKKLQVLRFHGLWKDLGTWNTLTEEMTESMIGEAMHDQSCKNLSLINELNVPILCMGLKDIIVSASPEGILIADKEQSSYIKPFVDKLQQRIMFGDKSWGSFTVLDVAEESLTVKVVLHSGHRMNYHSHEHRDEIWTIISGFGRTIVNGMEEKVRPGDVVTMQAGCKHTIIADTELRLIEVQLGKEISIDDKQKYILEI